MAVDIQQIATVDTEPGEPVSEVADCLVGAEVRLAHPPDRPLPGDAEEVPVGTMFPGHGETPVVERLGPEHDALRDVRCHLGACGVHVSGHRVGQLLEPQVSDGRDDEDLPRR